MTQKLIQGDQINEASVTAGDADLLNGQAGGFYLNANNINAGTINDAYLPASISSDITGNAASSTLATRSTDSDDSDALGGVAAASWAKLSSPALIGTPTAPTQTAGNNSTRLATTAFVTTAVASAGVTVVDGAEVVYSGAGTYLITGTVASGTVVGDIASVQIFARCTTADNNYSVNDVLSLNHVLSVTDAGGGPQNEGISVEIGIATTTLTSTVRVGNRGILILNHDTRANAHLTANRWNLYYKVIV